MMGDTVRAHNHCVVAAVDISKAYFDQSLYFLFCFVTEKDS